MTDSAALWRNAKFPMLGKIDGPEALAAALVMSGPALAAHNAMAAMLRRAPGEAFALMPFVPVLIDGRWHVAAAYDAHDGEALLIDGKSGEMRFGDDAQAVGFWGNASAHGERLRVYTNGVVFARDWAAARAERIDRCRRLNAAPDEPLVYGDMPGLCMIGTPEKIGNFADIAGAATIEIDNPRLRHLLADAMLRSARLPVVVARPPNLKVVAGG
jgi:hypothetical protein